VAFSAPPALSSLQLSGEVQLFQSDPSTGTTTLLNTTTHSLSSLVSSPQTLSVKLVSGDCHQLVVALSGMPAQGGQNNPPGIVASYTNYGASPCVCLSRPGAGKEVMERLR
jgi:hypothetical protein